MTEANRGFWWPAVTLGSLALLAGATILVVFVPLAPCPEAEEGIRRALKPGASAEEHDAARKRLLPFHPQSNCWLCRGGGKVSFLTKWKFDLSASRSP